MNSLLVLGVDFDGHKHRFVSGGEVDPALVRAAGDAARGCFSILASGIKLPGHQMVLKHDGERYMSGSDAVHLPPEIQDRLGDTESLYLSFKPCSRESLR